MNLLEVAHTTIMNGLKLSEFESTQAIYMKEPILVGSNENGPIYCTYVSDSSEGGFYLNVIFNEVECDLYGRDYNFTFISYNTPDGVKALDKDDKGLNIHDYALTYIADALNNWGNEWILEQRELRIKSRAYHRKAIQSSNEYKKKPTITYTWEERLENVYLRGMIEKYMWNRLRNHDLECWQKMVALGEFAYTQKEKHSNKRMRKFLKGTVKRITKKIKKEK